MLVFMQPGWRVSYQTTSVYSIKDATLILSFDFAVRGSMSLFEGCPSNLQVPSYPYS